MVFLKVEVRTRSSMCAASSDSSFLPPSTPQLVLALGFVRNFRTAGSGSNKKHLWEVKYPGEDAGQDVDEMELGELAAGIAKAHAMGAPEKMTLS